MSGTVVIVEDNAMNMKLLEQALSIAGYRTLKSTDGDNLVDLAASGGAHVVLMDIQLPKRSGVDLLRQLRADGRTNALPVLAVTAFADLDSVNGFLAEGFNQVITKPISIRNLLEQVAQYCPDAD